MARISMSQHGPLLMGVSDVLSRATSVAAVWAMLRNGHGATETAGFEAAGVVSGRGMSRCIYAQAWLASCPGGQVFKSMTWQGAPPRACNRPSSCAPPSIRPSPVCRSCWWRPSGL